MSLAEKELFDVGYWTGDPGDSVDEVRRDPYYGIDGDINDNYPFAPPEVDQAINEEDEANVALNDDEDIEFVKELMGKFWFWGGRFKLGHRGILRGSD